MSDVAPPTPPPPPQPGVDPRTIPPPPPAAPAVSNPPAGAAPAEDPRISQLQQEAARNRLEAQQARQATQWLGGLGDNQLQYLQDVALAMSTGDAEAARRLGQMLAGQAPQQQQYQPPPPPQPVWDQYQQTWVLPDPNYSQQQPYYPPQQQYPPPQSPPANPLFNPPPQAAAPDADTIAQLIESKFGEYQRVQEMRSSVDRVQQELNVPPILDRAARQVALDNMRASDPSLPVPDLGILYREAVDLLRQAALPGMENGGPVPTAPPPGVTPTPEKSQPTTKQERIAAAERIATIHGARPA